MITTRPAPPVGPFAPATGARILSFGGYQPGNVVTNDDLAASVDTSDEWIRSRVGIVSRRMAGTRPTVETVSERCDMPRPDGTGSENRRTAPSTLL